MKGAIAEMSAASVLITLMKRPIRICCCGVSPPNLFRVLLRSGSQLPQLLQYAFAVWFPAPHLWQYIYALHTSRHTTSLTTIRHADFSLCPLQSNSMRRVLSHQNRLPRVV